MLITSRGAQRAVRRFIEIFRLRNPRRHTKRKQIVKSINRSHKINHETRDICKREQKSLVWAPSCFRLHPKGSRSSESSFTNYVYKLSD